MTPEEKQEIIGWVYDCTDGKGQVLFGIQSFESFLSAMPEESEAQITKRMIEEAVKDLTKDGQFQWRDGQVYAEEIIDWLDKEGEG